MFLHIVFIKLSVTGYLCTLLFSAVVNNATTNMGIRMVCSSPHIFISGCVYLKDRIIDLSSSSSIFKCSIHGKLKPGTSIIFWVSYGSGRSPGLGPSGYPFPGPLVGNWIGSGVVRIQTDAHMGCQCHK